MKSASRPNAALRVRSAVAPSVARAAAAAVEPLEGRLFMAGDASVVQSLPYALEFDSARAGTLVDKDGEGTGFTWAQPNKLANEYQPALIDLRTAEGLLYLTTTGTSAAGGPFENDNTLVNALQSQFNASSGSFTMIQPKHNRAEHRDGCGVVTHRRSWRGRGAVQTHDAHHQA